LSRPVLGGTQLCGFEIDSKYVPRQD